MGKHNFFVSHKSKMYFHETKVHFRRENIPMSVNAKPNSVVRDRHADVFKLWQKDTPEILAKTYDLDFSYSKLGGVIRNQPAQEDVREAFLKHYVFIKDLFLTLVISCAGFPYIGIQDFTRFAKQVELMDSVLTQSRVDYIISGVKARPKGLDL